MRIESLAIIDFRERTTNALIRLLGCSDRSVPLLFACNKTRLYVFSMGLVLFSISLQCVIPVGKHQMRRSGSCILPLRKKSSFFKTGPEK